MSNGYSPRGNDQDGYIIDGPGLIGRHDVPTFETRAAAETACRCFTLAFQAGMRHRSSQFKALIEGFHIDTEIPR